MQAVVELDPARAALYRANGERLQARLQGLDKALARRLEPLRERPFLVFHDAYRYLETRYGLRSVGAVVAGPERGDPSAVAFDAMKYAQARGADVLIVDDWAMAPMNEVERRDFLEIWELYVDWGTPGNSVLVQTGTLAIA